MGIVRYAVECPGCRVGIVLRLGVGHESRQPFFYVCPNCQAATRGIHIWHGDARTELELVAGRQLEDYDSCVHTISINPEFPSIPGAIGMEQPGGSPFITFAQLLGDGILTYQKVFYQVRGTISSDWESLARLTTYYLRRDWTHFDRESVQLVPKIANNVNQDWQRDDLIHRLYEITFMSLISCEKDPFYVHMKSEWNPIWSPSRPHFSQMVSFAKSEVTTSTYNAVQRDMFSHFERYASLIDALLPGLLCNMLPSGSDHLMDRDMRLFRDDYEKIRDLYIQVFESCHKALRWVVGAVNVDTHGDPDRFVAPVGSKAAASRPPKNLDDFARLVSARKREWLVLLPSWDRSWDHLFDRQLRNDIGHASAHHELSTGQILREGKGAISYLRFVALVQRMINAMFATSNALKIVRIYSY